MRSLSTIALIALALPVGAQAQTALHVKEQRTLSYPAPLGGSR